MKNKGTLSIFLAFSLTGCSGVEWFSANERLSTSKPATSHWYNWNKHGSPHRSNRASEPTIQIPSQESAGQDLGVSPSDTVEGTAVVGQSAQQTTTGYKEYKAAPQAHFPAIDPGTPQAAQKSSQANPGISDFEQSVMSRKGKGYTQ